MKKKELDFSDEKEDFVFFLRINGGYFLVGSWLFGLLQGLAIWGLVHYL